MLKAKIERKTTKSNCGKVRVKASIQPEFKKQKKFKGGWRPTVGGTDPQNFFSHMSLNFTEICEKWHFLSKKFLGVGYPLPLPQK